LLSYQHHKKFLLGWLVDINYREQLLGGS